MIRINLLPFRAARKKENVRRQISIFILSLAFLCLCLYVVNNMLNKTVISHENMLEESKKEVDRLKKITDEIKKIQKDIEISERKTEILKRLEADRIEPVALIDRMTELVVPSRMWFTSFQATDNNVVVEGVAIDNKTVADFMTNLEKSKLFSAVNLDNLKLRKIKDLDMKGFKISCVKSKKS